MRGNLSRAIDAKGTILDLAEQAWAGELYRDGAAHPVHSTLPQGEEIFDGVWVFEGMASVNVLDTGDGLIMLDTGGQPDAEAIFEQVRHWRPDAPLIGAVFSHHHIDHIFGTELFDLEAERRGWPTPVVYGHAAVSENLDRYRLTRGWNTVINRRQFVIDSPEFSWPSRFRYPDITYQESMTFRRGDLTFELRHGRGETDDATWTWIPERKILHPGDLFIWAVPNAGNPQKVQRYAGDWAASLREMAAVGAEIMLPGHGLPIIGASRIHQALTDTAELLESLESQTLDLMNAGAVLDTVLHEVRPPTHLLERPYLLPVYDDPQFLIRNIWRCYGGWYDGHPDNLLPAPRAEQAAEWVTLAGGADAVLDRAEELGAAGDLALACHLTEGALLADPDYSRVHRVRAEVFAARASEQTSSMARNILNHAAASSRAGVRDLASTTFELSD